jgi:hypothetical protein
MKKIMNRFICDNCGKESNLFEEGHKFHTGYPYEEGWVYLHSFSFKEKKDTQKTSCDKHFCCMDCMKTYLINKLETKK